MIRLIFLFLPLLLIAPSQAQERPPAGYASPNICPFECCTYRQWTADEDIPVHARRNDQSAVVFRLRRGEKLRALGGVIITNKAGVIRIDHEVEDGYVNGSDAPQLTLKEGDVIYMLSPLGEGAYLFWYEGKVYRSGNDLRGMPEVDGAQLDMTWWKHVKNKAGKTGWTHSDKFNHADACG
ncbi:MAG: hypothetical protein V4463_04665 [Pseudomonadota bacterium]